MSPAADGVKRSVLEAAMAVANAHSDLGACEAS